MRALLVSLLLSTSLVSFAADNVKLNPKLDYTSDSQDGPLITGDNMDAGIVAGRPAYIILYGEGCYNSKRQARRTVNLYERYKDHVQFVIVDLDRPLSSAQRELRKQFYRGYIPHVIVLNASGEPLYNASGEVEELTISRLLDNAVR